MAAAVRAARSPAVSGSTVFASEAGGTGVSSSSSFGGERATIGAAAPRNSTAMRRSLRRQVLAVS